GLGGGEGGGGVRAGGGGLRQADAFRIRVEVGGGVAVHDPQDVPVGDHRVRVAVQRQERSRLGDPVERVAVVEDLRVAVDRAGQQDVELAELDGVQEAVQRGAHRHAAAPGIGEVLLAARVLDRVVKLLPGPTGWAADDRVRVLLRAEV